MAATAPCQVKGCPVVLRVPAEHRGPVLCPGHRDEIERMGAAPPADDPPAA